MQKLDQEATGTPKRLSVLRRIDLLKLRRELRERVLYVTGEVRSRRRLKLLVDRALIDSRAYGRKWPLRAALRNAKHLA